MRRRIIAFFMPPSRRTDRAAIFLPFYRFPRGTADEGRSKRIWCVRQIAKHEKRDLQCKPLFSGITLWKYKPLKLKFTNQGKPNNIRRQIIKSKSAHTYECDRKLCASISNLFELSYWNIDIAVSKSTKWMLLNSVSCAISVWWEYSAKKIHYVLHPCFTITNEGVWILCPKPLDWTDTQPRFLKYFPQSSFCLGF